MNGSQRALQLSCRMVGLDPGGATLLRLGSNAADRLEAPVIARISRPAADAGPVHRSIAVARWLAAVDYPAVRATEAAKRITALRTGASRKDWQPTKRPPRADLTPRL